MALVKWLLVSLALASGAMGQVTEYAVAWREWMAELQDEYLQSSGTRIYLMTEREVLQTGSEQAKFQNGRYRMILADGSVPDVDGDVDGYTDVYEDGFPMADRNDSSAIPMIGEVPAPPDTFQVVPPLLMADGSLLGIADSTIDQNTKAVNVRPKTGSNVRVTAAPANSSIVRPTLFRDFSSLFYYSKSDGTSAEYPLSLYYLEKNFPNPGDGSALERDIAPGVYTVEYPTFANSPTGRGYAAVEHDMVPNGTLNVGQKTPNWLVRSLTSLEEPSRPPVPQKWVDGRLKFDPYLPLTLTWDNLVSRGLASSADFIDILVEDDTGRQISYNFRVKANESSISFDMSSTMNYSYGTIGGALLGNPAPPLTINGHIVLRYSRYANYQSQADLSTVTLKVPVEMSVSYASWKLSLFPEDSANDSISGPDADPDGDGLTNQQEFNVGSDPTVATFAVTDPTSADITSNSATLGATIESDPFSGIAGFIYETGVIYSATSTNSYPMLDWPGVIRAVSTEGVGTFTVPVTGLADNTQYSYRGYAITSLGTFYSSRVSTFTTPALPPVTVPTVTSPTSGSLVITGFPGEISANLGGNVTSDGGSPITDRGVVYSVASSNDNPFIGGSEVIQISGGAGTTGAFTVSTEILAKDATYSFRAYAINAVGTSYTSEVGTFTTPTDATVTSPTHTAVTSSSATLGGNVTSSGGLTILQRGVVFSPADTNPDPEMGGLDVIAFAAPSPGTGVFTLSATGLLPATTYSYKAFAYTFLGISYSPLGTFTTSGALATITAPTLTDITATTATLGAEVTDDGAATITERGFIYSPTAANSNPMVGDSGVIQVIDAGVGLGPLSANISGLTANTGYTFKAYAINSAGTAYSTPYAFFTTLQSLTVTTSEAVDIAVISARLGGAVSSDGGAPVTEKGVLYSDDPNTELVIDGNDPKLFKVEATGSTGVFTVDVNGLVSKTVYYFRAYATDGGSTSYGEERQFETLYVPPLIVTATTVTNRYVTTVTLGGTVGSDEPTNVDQVGVVYTTDSSTAPVIDGPGVTQIVSPAAGAFGPFTVDVTGLLPNTAYYFRAYATNLAGTSYSNVGNFTTLPKQAPILVEDPTATDITSISATLGGDVLSDGGNPVLARGFFYTDNETVNPVLGSGAAASAVITDPAEPFTVSVTGLNPDVTYYFRAYASSASGISYSGKGSFTTLSAGQPMPLLGQAKLKWVPGTNPTLQVESNLLPAPPEEPSPAVPEFVYRKAPTDRIYALDYRIEVSTDFVNWHPIGGVNWLAEETDETVGARWNPASGSPPDRAFFRISGITQ